MPGPPPKHAAQRRRTNASVRRILPSQGPDSVPELPGRSKMLASTRAWWEAVWCSPMAHAYLDADARVLMRLAQMIDLASRGKANAALLTETRQLEDRLGLSPMARRRLEWDVAAPPGAEPESTPGNARRVRLRAVDPSAVAGRPGDDPSGAA